MVDITFGETISLPELLAQRHQLHLRPVVITIDGKELHALLRSIRSQWKGDFTVSFQGFKERDEHGNKPHLVCWFNTSRSLIHCKDDLLTITSDERSLAINRA